MHRLAVIRRQDKQGKVRDAAVNVAHVRYVYCMNSGSYIVFEDEYDSTTLTSEASDAGQRAGDPSNAPGEVTPIGMMSPDSIDIVIKRLNRPYWIDVVVRVGSLVVLVVSAGLTLYIALS